jgi:crotonobetainyl-CoA:carnitine CoA-transferase CaiB-like acyl-CoA transferase
LERLLANEVPSSPAYDAAEALHDPQALHLGLEVEAMHPEMGRFRTVRAPYSFDGDADRQVAPPPVLDEHGTEIRSELERRRGEAASVRQRAGGVGRAPAPQ